MLWTAKFACFTKSVCITIRGVRSRWWWTRRGAALLLGAAAALPAVPAAAGGTYRYMSTYVVCQGGSHPRWGADAYSDTPEAHLDLTLSGFDGARWVTLDHRGYDKWTGIRGKFFYWEVRKHARFGDRYKRYRVVGRLTRGDNWTSDTEEC